MNVSISSVKGQKLLVAISGGVDSVVLAHYLHSQKCHIVLAHCNFQLRGEESDGDEAFVRSFAQMLGVPLEVVRFDTREYAATHRLNTQLAARELRYQWFEELLRLHGCHRLVTAHQANDCIETFFINLSRGCGLSGLLGIPAATPTVVRPLLQVSREDIVAYAKAHRLQWREDSSNASDHYVRNRIRHHIYPPLEKIHPQFLENFQRTQSYLQQANRFIEFYLEKIKEEVFVGNFPIYIASEKLLSYPETDFLLHHLFYPYGFGNIEDLRQLFFKASSGKKLLSDTHQLLKDTRGVWLAEGNSPFFPPEIVYEELLAPFEIEKVRTVAYIDADKLRAPLHLRRKREGDSFFPIGLGKRKKLSKFFVDEKYTQAAREEQWLLCCGEEIVWVIGKRLDERFKVTDKTQRVLIARLQTTAS